MSSKINWMLNVPFSIFRLKNKFIRIFVNIVQSNTKTPMSFPIAFTCFVLPSASSYAFVSFSAQQVDIFFVTYVTQKHVFLNRKFCYCSHIDAWSNFSTLCSFRVGMASCCWFLRVSIKYHNNFVSLQLSCF